MKTKHNLEEVIYKTDNDLKVILEKIVFLAEKRNKNTRYSILLLDKEKNIS